MTAPLAKAASAPGYVSFLNPILKLLLRFRVPLGPNALVTIRGRTSGEPRTTPLAIVAADGRRWVWSPWGEVNWVRNLRAAGRATVTIGGRGEDVHATELDAEARVGFFRDVLRPMAHRIPMGVAFVRVIDGVDVEQPAAAAVGRVVFELQPMR